MGHGLASTIHQESALRAFLTPWRRAGVAERHEIGRGRAAPGAWPLGAMRPGRPWRRRRFHAAARGAAPLSASLGCCDRRRPWSLGSGGLTGGVSPRRASCGAARPCPSERAPLLFGGARPRPRCARRPLAPTLGAPTAGAEGPPPQAGRRLPPASHRHARKGRPVAPAPWRSCARSERARRAGPAAGMARHRPSRAVCPPLRGQGGLGGAFRPPGKDNA